MYIPPTRSHGKQISEAEILGSKLQPRLGCGNLAGSGMRGEPVGIGSDSQGHHAETNPRLQQSESKKKGGKDLDLDLVCPHSQKAARWCPETR
jgi:hypothetical protein